MDKDSSINDRDLSLGQFMHAYSELELALSFAFAEIFKIDFHIANAIFLNMQTPKFISLLKTSAIFRINNPKQLKLIELCKQFRSVAEKRNKIVHGKWTWETSGHYKDSTGQPTSQWVRLYQSINPWTTLEALNPENVKLHRDNRFTIKQLSSETNKINQLSKDFFEFIKPLQIKSFHEKMSQLS